MPALGMAQDTGKLVGWLKHEGDSVQKGEPIMEVETDKVTVEIEAPASGTLSNVNASAGDDVPVGQVIALILAPGESAPPSSQTPSTQPVPTAEKAAAPAARSAVAAPAPGIARFPDASPVAARVAAEHGIDLSLVEASGKRIKKADVFAFMEAQAAGSPAVGIVLASPKARRLANEYGFALDEIPGTGPQGAVLANDVLSYGLPAIAAEPSQPAPVGVNGYTHQMPMSNAWRIMAQRLQESWQTVPHFYLSRDVNAGGLVAWRQELKERIEVKVTFTDLLVKVAAVALRHNLNANAYWLNDQIIWNNEVNVGLAVAVEDGLIVPVIHNADKLGLREIAEHRADIVSRALDAKLKPDDLRGGTFTISNLGMYGIDSFNAIINPPQAAILAVGSIRDTVVSTQNGTQIHPFLTLNLSCDHRVVDGARGAAFMDALARFIEDPMAMLD